MWRDAGPGVGTGRVLTHDAPGPRGSTARKASRCWVATLPEAAAMGVLLVAIFEDEAGAKAGACALRDLHAEGILTLYASAVVARRAKGGGLEIRRPIAEGEGLSAPAVGAAVGALVSLLGGPVTAAARTTPSGLLGPVRDLAEAGLDAEFLEQVSRDLRPGQWSGRRAGGGGAAAAGRYAHRGHGRARLPPSPRGLAGRGAAGGGSGGAKTRPGRDLRGTERYGAHHLRPSGAADPGSGAETCHRTRPGHRRCPAA